MPHRRDQQWRFDKVSCGRETKYFVAAQEKGKVLSGGAGAVP